MREDDEHSPRAISRRLFTSAAPGTKTARERGREGECMRVERYRKRREEIVNCSLIRRWYVAVGGGGGSH